MNATSGFIQNNHRPIGNNSGGRLYSPQGSKLKEVFKTLIAKFRSSITTGETKRELDALILEIAHQAIIEKTYDRDGLDQLKPSTIFNALKLAGLLSNRIPRPEVDIDPDGELSFEWYQAPNKLLSISIGQDGRLAYAGRFGLKRISGIDYLGEQFPNELAVFIERMY
jgi:hypothetical protein